MINHLARCFPAGKSNIYELEFHDNTTPLFCFEIRDLSKIHKFSDISTEHNFLGSVFILCKILNIHTVLTTHVFDVHAEIHVGSTICARCYDQITVTRWVGIKTEVHEHFMTTWQNQSLIITSYMVFEDFAPVY